ncbi:hypothetical protein P389DRAFT_9896 [Cystobasidium minutum MCA 4210]|uniref:uncharacterized protein n=1 Tax=Cystobasidium minutum MCA 4210 TaxID=1397322 RepID=UPI0034CD20F2|eukprot:jgi/Rhomi1/9896/CE9895_2208
MTNTDAVEKKTRTSSTSTKRGQATDLAARIGKFAEEELQRPLCFICSSQTSYTGSDLQFEVEDSDYKCPICADPRQYIGISGQKWTSLAKLHTDEKNYHNEFKEVIPGKLWSFRTVPSIGIGQRAFLMKDPSMERLVMWDCVAYIDDATLEKIDELSGGKGIAHMVVSHPHYYSTTATWTAAFPEMKLWLAEVDFYDWHQRRDLVQAKKAEASSTGSASFATSVVSRLQLVKAKQTALPGSSSTKILLLGGHFPGSLVLLWEDCLFIADTVQVVPSGLYKSGEPQRPGMTTFSFMWSYPNQIPLSAAEVERVCKPLETVHFERAFGAFEGFDVWGQAKEKVMQSRDIIIGRLRAP